MDILRYKPKAYWKLDNTSPYTDYSGYSNSATLSGTEQRAVPLTSHCAYSQLLNSSKTITYGYSPFGNSSIRPFSMAATVLPLNTAAPQTNLALNPAMISTGNSGEINTRWSWTKTYLTGQNSSPLTTAVRMTSPATAQDNTSGRGLDINWNPEVATPHTNPTSSCFYTPVSPGEILTLSAWARWSVAVSHFAGIRFHDGNGNWVGGTYTSSNQAVIAGVWQRISHTITVPEGAAYAVGTIKNGPNASFPAGSTMDITGLMWTKSTLQPYFDGIREGYKWNGTPNNSTSSTDTNIGRVNLVVDPGATAVSNYGGSGGNGAVKSITTEWSNSGTTSLKIVPSGSSVDSSANIGGDTGVMRSNMLPGRTYTVSATAYVPNAFVGTLDGRHRRIQIYYKLLNGSYTTSTSAVAPTGVPTRLSVTVSIPDNANEAFVRLYNGSNNVNDVIYYDDVMIEEAGQANPFFSGDSNGAYWSGTRNASPSYSPTPYVEQQIISSPGQMDGLTINGNVVSFSTIHTTGEARASYTLDYLKRVSLLGVHTPTKNSLYVDGELVAEQDLDFSQINAPYLTTPATVISGATTSSRGILINETAIFESALDASAAKTIYQGQTRGGKIDIPSVFGGERIQVSTVFRKPSLAFVWKDATHWDKAMQVNCITDEDYLIPETRDGLSVSAQWLTSVNMYNGSGPLNINEINVDYTGYGATVSISLDGMNWTVVNGSVAMSFNSLNKDLYVKVDFAAGMEEAYLDNLYINLYSVNTATTTSGRTVTYNSPTTVLREYAVQDMNSKWGARIDSGGSISFTTPGNPYSVGIWVKPETSVNMNRIVSGTTYLNGVAATNQTLLPGIWYYLSGTGYSGTYTISANVTVGEFSTYTRALTAAEVANIYRSYIGPIVSTVTDTATLGLSETSTPVVIYGTDYTTISGNT